MMRLRGYSSHIPKKGVTGYSHGNSHQRVFGSLTKFSPKIPIIIASNSPYFHVRRVLDRLGLARLNITAIVTPGPSSFLNIACKIKHMF